MTNVEGIPKSEDQMEHQQVQSRRFEFQDSGFFRHWSFVIRISVASALLAGCATRVEVVPVTQLPFASKGASWQPTPPWWSEDSLNRKVLHRHNLGRLIHKDPERALAELEDVVSRSQQTEDIAALADLTFRYGRKLEHTEPQKSMGLYLVAAAIGYHHLIEQNKPSCTNQWDLRIRESYNKATAGVVMLLQKLPVGLRTNHVASACGQSFEIETKSGDFSSDPLYYDRWLPVDSWKQRGSRSHYWRKLNAFSSYISRK